MEDKNNISYVYKLIDDVRKCIHQKNCQDTLTRYEISKLVPLLEKVLGQACKTSREY